jgi:predicted transglutaminase-like cysteine proteinase
LGDGVVFQSKTLRELTLAAGLWLTASACVAAPQPSGTMTLGASAMPPPAYMAFCKRQPQDCGDDAQFVLASVMRANSQRTALYAQLSSPAPAAIGGPALGAVVKASWQAPSAPAPAEALLPVADPLVATPQRALIATSAIFIDPAAEPQPASETGLPSMTPELWAKLNSINARVNGSIVQRSDEANYGLVDYWTTPIEDGQHFGDCEDFALEKQRALIAAGLPRQAVNIALVTTPWGESHAVLLVSTRSGDYALDSLNPWVTPWQRTGYRWRQREVNGNPFTWAMIEDPARRVAPRRTDAPLLIASAQ